MVDQLNNANRQPQPADTASSLRRLEALLAAGQTRTGQVVQSTPQPTGNPTPTQSQPNASTQTGGQAAAQNPASATAQQTIQTPAPTLAGQLATTAASQPSGTVANQPAAASTATPGQSSNPPLGQPATTQDTGQQFRVQIRIEGKLFELLTQRALTPGSQVQLSRSPGGQISIQTGNAPAANSAPKGQAAPATTTPGITPTNSQATGRGIPATSATPSAPTSSTAALAAGVKTQTTLANTANITNSAPQAGRGAAATSSNNPASAGTTSPGPAPNPPASGTSNTATTGTQGTMERINLQLISGQLALRPGQQLSAEVLGSRVLPAGTGANAAATNANATNRPQSNPQTTSTLQASENRPAQSQPASQFAVKVRAQGQLLELSSPRDIASGTRIELNSSRQGQLWSELPSARTRSIEQALREHLPQQQAPAPLLNLLSSVQSSGQLQQAKPMLLNLVQILLGRTLASPQQADAESVRQQVQNSGTMMENKLARGDTQGLLQDHKALLLKMSQQLGQNAGQRELPAALSERLTQLTQQALSRVLVNQLTSAAGQTQDGGNEANRTLALDIPILWNDKTENLQLQIQRDARGDDPDNGETLYRWQIKLNFEINQTEHLQAELTLEGSKVSIIWSGDRSIRTLVEQQLDQLQQRLENIGLEVKTLGVKDEPVETASVPRPPRNRLIDIKT